MRNWKVIGCLSLVLFMFGCTDLGPGWDVDNGEGLIDPEKADSGVETVFLDFSFDGELITDWVWQPKNTIETQLMYTVGQLNGERSVGRLDRLDLTNINTEEVGEKTRITYHAVMIVAWNKRNQERQNYTLVLPKDVSSSGKADFFEKYHGDCSSDSHPVEGTYWYYYRPNKSGCELDENHVIRRSASMSPSEVASTGKYPEYHKIFEDDALRVVAVFGKNEEGATDEDWDAGINTYNQFARSIKNLLRDNDLETTPEEIPYSPGVAVPEIELRATNHNGDKVVVNALLIDSVGSAGSDFNQRYSELTKKADFIVYNGHSGYGANIRAMAQKGTWVTGQYVIVWMNGCDTYAYVDSALAKAHAQVNPDDEVGTKYVDLIMNAMPGYFSDHAYSSTHMIRSLMNREAPKTYEQIFESIASRQVVLVSGEKDNEYHPGMIDPDPDPWEGLQKSGQLGSGETVNYQTPRLKAGTYLFEMTGSGDADLYVRVGQAPTRQAYDCRPYGSDSNENCSIDLTSDGVIYLMISGYSEQSGFSLVGRAQGQDPDPEPWEGMRESGQLSAGEEVSFQTATLLAGDYLFEMTGSGDADLYVRVGQAPSRSTYDCRPYKADSNETCRVTLVSDQVVYLMVSGYSDNSGFNLVGSSD